MPPRKTKASPAPKRTPKGKKVTDKEDALMAEVVETPETNGSNGTEDVISPGTSLDDEETSAKTRILETISDKDLLNEEAILRHPQVLKAWLRYLEAKNSSASGTASFEEQAVLLQRAVAQLPGSFKLWKALISLRLSYLLTPPAMDDKAKDSKDGKSKGKQQLSAVDRIKEFLSWIPAKPFTDLEWERTNACFEQALVLCHKFPMVWLTYLVFLMHQPHRVTLTRRTFDRALQALPVTQHPMIWKLYLIFAEAKGGETCVRIWKRYLTLNPKAEEDFVAVLLDLEPPRYAQAAHIVAGLVARKGYTSTSGKSKFQLWQELCDLVTEHPDEIQDSKDTEPLDVDAILRSGITQFTDQVGKIWNSLARWWILQGEWEKARDVYEEALKKVYTVRDFSMVFDTYAKMEEDILSVQMRELDLNGPSDNLDDTDIDMGLARFERLMERRPFLVSDVLLRQNPHNVGEWENRVRLWKDMSNLEKVVETYTTALKTISPKKAVGSLPSLWTSFANFYLDNGDIDKARQVYEKAVKSSYKSADDLVSVWCTYAEMEVNASEAENALAVLNRAVAPPKGSYAFRAAIRYNDESREPHIRLFKSLKLWSFLVDLEESIGTVESTKTVYDRIIELKIATPQVIVNYATFLEENDYFEESFRVYERGIESFGYPIAFEIWNIYLDKFMERYKGSKLERARDLFEQSLDKIPAKFAKSIFLRYAKMEEDFGLARRAMDIYDRAIDVVSPEDKFKIFEIYLAKATSFFGLASTRDIYSKAIQTLPNKECRLMCLSFAAVEIKLGEVDRARVIYTHCSQLCDPSTDTEFWKTWSEFEVKFGNEDTFKEMLRLKRSVQAKFNADIHHLSTHLLAKNQNGTGVLKPSDTNTEPKTMADLENLALAEQTANLRNGGGTAVTGFVRAQETEPVNPSSTQEKEQEPSGSERLGNQNPDEIMIDDDETDDDASDEEEEEEHNDTKPRLKLKDVQKVSVPDAVFGSLKRDTVDPQQETEEPMAGAKARLLSKRKH